MNESEHRTNTDEVDPVVLIAAGEALAFAKSHDLPGPRYVTVDGYDKVALQFETLDRLTEWAVFVEGVIESRDLEGSLDGVLHQVETAQVGDVAVHLYCVIYASHERATDKGVAA